MFNRLACSAGRNFAAKCFRFKARRMFSGEKFPGFVDRNDISAIQKVKDEARQKLITEKGDIDKDMLTVDQMTQKIVEIKSLEDFKEKIVERQKPIVMFCMAKWCNTSKQLLPTVLEQYSINWELWDLALFDIDTVPKLTTVLQLNKIPTVLLVAYGDIVDGFKGLVSATEVENFFKAANKVGEQYTAGVNINAQFEKLIQAYEGQDWGQILEVSASLKKSPVPPGQKRLIQLFEVTALVKSGREAEGQALFETVNSQPVPETQEEVVKSIRQIEDALKSYFSQIKEKQASLSGDFQVMLKDAGNDPDKLFALSSRCIEQEVFDIALESLLRIVKKEKHWNDKAAFNRFVELLKNPKVPKQLIKEYRIKLGSIIA